MRLCLIVVGGLVAVIVLALAGMIVFGTAAAPARLDSLGEPFRHVDFGDLPAARDQPSDVRCLEEQVRIGVAGVC